MTIDPAQLFEIVLEIMISTAVDLLGKGIRWPGHDANVPEWRRGPGVMIAL